MFLAVTKWYCKAHSCLYQTKDISVSYEAVFFQVLAKLSFSDLYFGSPTHLFDIPKFTMTKKMDQAYEEPKFLMHCKPIPCNENRVFPVKFSHREIPVMKTGVPAMRTGVPCYENRFFPVWKTSQGKPCSGPVLAL
jgi:hypothetical protein